MMYPFGDSTILGIILLIISYLAGDLMILPRMGNGSATIGDLLLGVVVLWGGLNLLGYTEALGEAFLAAAMICVGEYFPPCVYVKNTIQQYTCMMQ